MFWLLLIYALGFALVLAAKIVMVDEKEAGAGERVFYGLVWPLLMVYFGLGLLSGRVKFSVKRKSKN